MQSQRKNSGSYFTRQQSSLSHSTTNNPSNKKKVSVASQTDNFPNFLKDISVCNFALMSMEEIKENYTKTLYFLNYCHDFINKMFGESANRFGGSKIEKVFEFRVPDVPNYFNVLEMFVEKCRVEIADPVCNKTGNLRGVKRNMDVKDVNNREMDDEQIIFDLQQFLPKSIGDGPGSLNSPRSMMPNYGEQNFSNQTKFKNRENVKMDNGFFQETGVGIKKFVAKKRNSASPSRLVKSEKHIPKRSSRHELKALSTTFEEILKTCNDFERQSKEHLLKKDIPLEFYHQSLREKGINLVLEKFEQGDQKTQRQEQEMITKANYQSSKEDIQSGEQSPDTSEEPRESFNLIEYALKHLKESQCDSDSPSQSPKNKALVNSESIKMISSKGLLSENLSDIFFGFQDISATSKKSLAVLNETYQSQSPKKVNQMFQKISRENLRGSERADDNCDFCDSATFIEFMDNDNFSDQYGREYSSKAFIENCNQNFEDNGGVRMASSSDSIILTDEEFERKNRNSSLAWSKENINVSKQDKFGNNVKADGSAQEIIYKPVKSHPLKLTDKDRSLADQKMLQTIGLFTEKGDIRPGVISILEEKQRMKFAENTAKNLQFRTERKFDLQVHYNVNSKTKHVEKQLSKGSLNIKSMVDQHTGSDTSIHSSAVTFSSSTVSDSDLLSMEPNSDQTVIKKF